MCLERCSLSPSCLCVPLTLFSPLRLLLHFVDAAVQRAIYSVPEWVLNDSLFRLFLFDEGTTGLFPIFMKRTSRSSFCTLAFARHTLRSYHFLSFPRAVLVFTNTRNGRPRGFHSGLLPTENLWFRSVMTCWLYISTPLRSLSSLSVCSPLSSVRVCAEFFSPGKGAPFRHLMRS